MQELCTVRIETLEECRKSHTHHSTPPVSNEVRIYFGTNHLSVLLPRLFPIRNANTHLKMNFWVSSEADSLIKNPEM